MTGVKLSIQLGLRCKKRMEIRKSRKRVRNPESKSSYAPGLNFERLANLGSSQVRLTKIGLNFEISHLQKLDINWCDNLILPEWLGELESLRTLRIIGLPEMSTLPRSIQRLTSLQDLYIYYCHALHWVPEQLGELRSLRRLQLCNLPGLTSLPEGLQCLTSLLFLNLCNCATFKHLPESLGKLPALKTFWIQACPALTSLPCCIKRLVALEELCINNCPELVRRCKERVGEDWHLVSHIPCLTLS
jgi:Leucine-rich repeat (LRR) protein